ncbi:MAG TPA: hypothetical protein VMH22_03780 [bacterium]|nr:hypothetical protein [bacterium]
MPPTRFLYSANSYLAYKLNTDFYYGFHYVWCSPFYDLESIPPVDQVNPPSSLPCEIAWGLYQGASRGDENNPTIAQNKLGLYKGIDAQIAKQTISVDTGKYLRELVKDAKPELFTPMIYMMNYDEVKSLVDPSVKPQKPFSSEILIPALPRDKFEIMKRIFGPPA